MKLTLLALLSTGLLTLGASAHDCDRDRYECHDRGHDHYFRAGVCEVPVHKVCTEVIDSQTYCKTGVNHLGQPFVYRVKFVTYRDVYSDGSTRIYRLKLPA